MADKTGIQWTDATWNPIRGCSRVSEGCRNCYAEAVATRFSGPGQPYEGLVNLKPEDRHGITGVARTGVKGTWNGKILFVEKHLEDPLHWKRPRRIFVNSMSDLFHENVTEDMLDRIFAVMALAPQHTFQVLTKRPERARQYLIESCGSMPGGPLVETMALEAKHKLNSDYGWPLKNVWIGTSVEDQKTADARIPMLLRTNAAVRFISAEPLLGAINLRGYCHPGWVCQTCLEYQSVEHEACRKCGERNPFNDTLHGLDWVIVGGESGRHARPCALSHLRQVVLQCQANHVPVFVKQLGGRLFDDEGGGWTRIILDDKKGGDIAEFPEDLQVREYPRAA